MSNPRGNIKHGGCGTLTYARWKSMMARCHNTNATNYQYYGARGIEVCQQWRESFESFRKDMGDCPDEFMTLERLDNDAGSTPENCIWATKAEQIKHRVHCVQLTYCGRTMNVTDWAKEHSMSANALNQRLYLGWSVERALTQPIKKRTAR